MKKNLKKFFISTLVILGIIGGIFPVHASTIPIAPAVFETSLNTPISTSSTSMTLASGTLANGSSLSGYACFTVDSGNPNVEFICGTATGTSITSLLRGVDTLTGNTSVPSLIFSHRRGADVKITDFPVFSVVRNIANGTDSFPNILSYDSAPTFTTGNQIINKTYADNLAIAGCGNADTTSKGCVEIPTQAEVDAGTQLGGTGAYLATNPALTRARNYNNYAADSIGTDSYAITIAPAITAYAAGQVFTFKAGTANTGSASLNVSGLGAKTIKKDVSTDLITGDILANQIIVVEYDGTNMQLLSKTSPTTNSTVVHTYTASSSSLGNTTTRFDITNPAGTTFRYTYDGTGTDPGITSITMPIGSHAIIWSSSFNAVNIGDYAVTNSGSNFFEVTNASGVAENDKTLANGYLKVSLVQTWTKPAGLKYITTEVVGGGGGGGGASNGTGAGGSGGGGGGYAKENINASTLGSTESLITGIAGIGFAGDTGRTGGTSNFGTTPYLQATGGTGGQQSASGGAGGIGANGDINMVGNAGETVGQTGTSAFGGTGGGSFLGGGGAGSTANAQGFNGGNYGGGGGGARDQTSSSRLGGDGAAGIVIVTEFY